MSIPFVKEVFREYRAYAGWQHAEGNVQCDVDAQMGYQIKSEKYIEWDFLSYPRDVDIWLPN